jgi:hypothetical protein
MSNRLQLSKRARNDEDLGASRHDENIVTIVILAPFSLYFLWATRS